MSAREYLYFTVTPEEAESMAWHGPFSELLKAERSIFVTGELVVLEALIKQSGIGYMVKMQTYYNCDKDGKWYKQPVVRRDNGVMYGLMVGDFKDGQHDVWFPGPKEEVDITQEIVNGHDGSWAGNFDWVVPPPALLKQPAGCKIRLA